MCVKKEPGGFTAISPGSRSAPGVFEQESDFDPGGIAARWRCDPVRGQLPPSHDDVPLVALLEAPQPPANAAIPPGCSFADTQFGNALHYKYSANSSLLGRGMTISETSRPRLRASSAAASTPARTSETVPVMSSKPLPPSAIAM